MTMFIDHIGLFIPNTPELLRWIGRISAPIFIFCVGLGYAHTRNKMKYLARLYIAGVLMAFLNLAINIFYRENINAELLTNNFFATLFLVGLTIYITEMKGTRPFIYFMIWQIVSTFLCILLAEIFVIHPYMKHLFYGAIFGSYMFVEGGVFFVLFGVLLYHVKNRKSMVLLYVLAAFFFYISFAKFGGSYSPLLARMFPWGDYQWFMIASLPFVLLYNGEKGIGLKYLFYFFYPVHIVLLYILGVELAK